MIHFYCSIHYVHSSSSSSWLLLRSEIEFRFLRQSIGAPELHEHRRERRQRHGVRGQRRRPRGPVAARPVQRERAAAGRARHVDGGRRVVRGAQPEHAALRARGNTLEMFQHVAAMRRKTNKHGPICITISSLSPFDTTMVLDIILSINIVLVHFSQIV